MAGKVKRAKVTVRSAACPRRMLAGLLAGTSGTLGSREVPSHFTSWALGLFPFTSQTRGALGQHCVQGGLGGRPIDAQELSALKPSLAHIIFR